MDTLMGTLIGTLMDTLMGAFDAGVTNRAAADLDCVGWDVGGAHLKAARLAYDGKITRVAQAACPLWRGIVRLDDAYQAVLCELGDAPARHVVTMTAELADCFPNRIEGARAVIRRMGGLLNQPFAVYAGDTGIIAADNGRWAIAADAERWRRSEYAARVASMNWHATASLAARRLSGKRPGGGLLLDVGSTTTDLAPFRDGRLAARANSDDARLRAGELLYTGVVRTPVMALADHFDVDGEAHPVAAELFAAAADVYRLIGWLPERADQHPACDNGDKTPAGSARRLARMFGCDYAGAIPASLDHWRRVAHTIAGVQQHKIEQAVRRLAQRERLDAAAPVVGAGAGCFLAERVAQACSRPFIAFDALFDESLAPPPGDAAQRVRDCAAAVSVAWLATERSS